MEDNNKLLTFGQKAVGLTFNPSGDDAVTKIKQSYADIIDQLNEVRESEGKSEKARLASAAITEAQGAQMWAVKALTWKD
jgi:hypothetical protein